ncbi:MAG TPA: cytoplasmic protein, partial [Clostridiales bacterium]|nr:cytoplasmic protein [Clostridiales bacterium]
MLINNTYNEEEIVASIATALDNFYTNLIENINNLNIKSVMKRKNPYLFRAKSMNGAAQIVEAILAAFVSSSEETIFGNEFFEPIATVAVKGQKALAEGVDIMVERDDTIYAIAVKSGPHVYNAHSRNKQEQNFMAASKLAQQAKKRFVPIIGYGYGKKKASNRGKPKFYLELAGKDFWTALTGDEEFYIKL